MLIDVYYSTVVIVIVLCFVDGQAVRKKKMVAFCHAFPPQQLRWRLCALGVVRWCFAVGGPLKTGLTLRVHRLEDNMVSCGTLHY